MPAGIRGLVVAGLLAALMSSTAGAFNASSALFTIDFYQRLRPQSTQHHLVWVGRVATGVMVLISLLWIPVIQGSKGLYDYLQGVQGYLAPPIFAVFFLGVSFKRLNAKGCLAALIVGFLLGAFRLSVDTPVSLGMAGFVQGYPTGSFLWIINNTYFQYYSLFIFVVSCLTMIVVSALTAAPEAAKVTNLTFGTATAERRAQPRASRKRWGASNPARGLGRSPRADHVLTRCAPQPTPAGGRARRRLGRGRPKPHRSHRGSLSLGGEPDVVRHGRPAVQAARGLHRRGAETGAGRAPRWLSERAQGRADGLRRVVPG